MADATFERSRLATVFGGSGFLGRHIVRALARRGWRVRVAVRRPDLAAFPAADRRRRPDPAGAGEPPLSRRRSPPRSKARKWWSTPRACAPRAARRLTEPCMSTARRRLPAPRRPRAVETYAHLSGIGADAELRLALYCEQRPWRERDARRPSRTRRSCVRRWCSDRRTTFSIDSARWRAFSRSFRLFGGGKTRLQPVYAGDVARAAAAALAGEARPGTVYELGGPLVMTLREAAELALRTVERRRLLVGMPLGPSRLIASTTWLASRATLGRFPKASDDESRSGRSAGAGQCGVGQGRRRGASPSRPWHHTAGAGRDHRRLSCAVSQDRPV